MTNYLIIIYNNWSMYVIKIVNKAIFSFILIIVKEGPKESTKNATPF